MTASASQNKVGAKSEAPQSPSQAATNLKGPDVWVKKWVDYSSKYGLGYLLSNNATGVFFNDSTKIVLDPDGHHFEYMERRSSDRQDVVTSYTLMDYPKELQKKVTLLQHFRSYLEGDGTGKSEITEQEGDNPQKKILESIYVKKWMRTRHAIMFRLNNKIVQVNFQDHTEIILSSESRVVTYVNKKGERLTYPLTSALESTNVEMSKRLKYTKDVLTHMLNANTNTHGGPQALSSAGSGSVGLGLDSGKKLESGYSSTAGPLINK